MKCIFMAFIDQGFWERLQTNRECIAVAIAVNPESNRKSAGGHRRLRVSFRWKNLSKLALKQTVIAIFTLSVT